MKLHDITLKESAESLYDFVLEKYDGLQPDDLVVEPFDVLVKYYGEAGGHSDHPYGEGTAREHHGDTISIESLVANEAVHVTAESGPQLDDLKDHDKLHALVIGKLGTGTVTRVKALFEHAVVLNGGSIGKGTGGVLSLFSFFEDHPDDDVIIDVDKSPMLNDPLCVNMVKALLDGHASYHTHGSPREFDFTGRLVIVASDLHEINDAIERRCVIVDLTKDKSYPRGTALKDLPGWDDKQMKYFEEQAHKNFMGHQE